MKKLRKYLVLFIFVFVGTLFIGSVNASNTVFLIKSTKDISDKIPIYNGTNSAGDYCVTANKIDGVTSCENITSQLASNSDLVNKIANATENESFYVESTNTIEEDITVPKGVTASFNSLYPGTLVVNGNLLSNKILIDDNNSLVVNGYLKTGSLTFSQGPGAAITGTGNITFDYSYVDEDMNDMQQILGDAINAARFCFSSINGVKIGITGTDIKEGTTFGMIDTNATSDGKLLYTDAERQARLKILNDSLSADLSKNYEVVMENKSFSVSSDSYIFYYGVLKKKTTSDITTTTTSKIVNPKTEDKAFMIASLLGLISLGAFLTIKNIRKAN